MDVDLVVRIATFRWLTEQTMAQGDVLPRALLAGGFVYEKRSRSLAENMPAKQAPHFCCIRGTVAIS